jgi:UDP-N-acetylglucosamine 2-epimerase (non-hydrolysing)
MEKTIVSVVGARPNFMKIAPIEREIEKYRELRHVIVHTGQHYDRDMSDVFFDQLGLARPERYLGVGSGSHGAMTGAIMIAFERVCEEMKPDMALVVGDVNSSLAASIVARKLSIPVAHVEAGLRSFDESMPEEINRKLIDCISNLLFVTEPVGVENLRREGIEMARVHLVGDVMLETLQMFLPRIKERRRWEDFHLSRASYALATLHRPANVDDPHALSKIVDLVASIPYPVILPVHPRTGKRFEEFGLTARIDACPNLKPVPPQPYIDFLSLIEGAALILSDSGSIQSEASFFNVPCLACREITEHPIYAERGSVILVGRDVERVQDAIARIEKGYRPTSGDIIRELGEGVAERIVKIISETLV